MKFAVYTFLISFLMASVAHAEPAPHIMMTPGEIKWQPGPPRMQKGAMMAVLLGNPTEQGPFVIRLKLPAGYKIPAHTHTIKENVTVLSGSYNFGAGDKLDPSKGKLYSAGSYISTPSGTSHFVWTTAETIIQIHGMGPMGTNYLNPTDDPRGADKPPGK